MLIAPFLTSYLLRVLAWKVILGNEGVINTFLFWTGAEWVSADGLLQNKNVFAFSPWSNGRTLLLLSSDYEKQLYFVQLGGARSGPRSRSRRRLPIARANSGHERLRAEQHEIRRTREP